MFLKFSGANFLALLPLLAVDLTSESPVTTTTTSLPPLPDRPFPEVRTEPNSATGIDTGLTKPTAKQNAEISYFWHQKGRDLMPLWPLESPTATGKSGSPSTGDRVILIHRISDDDGSLFRKQTDPNLIPIGFGGGGRGGDKMAAAENENDNNIFVFCLMFLFGLIICGLMWCLCTVSRHQVDGSPGESYSGRRMNSRFGSRRRADIEVILPYTTGDLPPSYDDIVADFEKLGQQCILPSYKDIMGRKGSAESVASESPQHRASTSPPPRYTSPVGSFSAQGSGSGQAENSADAEQPQRPTTAEV